MTFWLVAIPVVVLLLGIAFLYDRRESARRRRLGEAPPRSGTIPETDPEVAMRYHRPHQG